MFINASTVANDSSLLTLRAAFGQAYNGVLARALATWSIDFEKASRSESVSGFVPVAKQWVVERTIAWTNYFRRLVKDYEHTISSSVSWLFLANIQIMLGLLEVANQI